MIFICIASLKSLTYAIKAQKVLSNYYINAEIVKLDSTNNKKGCSYGVKFDCINLYSAENALKNNNVKYFQIITTKD